MNIAIIGFGKMGKEIESLAIKGNHSIVLAINSSNLKDFTTKNLQLADVAIEFSRPEFAKKNIKKCLESGIPTISGTTGWTNQLEEIEDICRKNDGAFLYASNFSIGVNIFFAVNQFLAKQMNSFDYNISIEEIHHTQKLDAPSGTAISLANDIIKQIDRKETWINAEAQMEHQIGIHSKRIDPAPGTHKILYQTAIDEIEIKHTAHSRKGFASGALMAANWIIGKKGIFTMKDVIGFKN